MAIGELCIAAVQGIRLIHDIQAQEIRLVHEGLAHLAMELGAHLLRLLTALLSLLNLI
ncbi:hypothetical protein FQZ97_1264960 [compost metagenome]